MSHSFSLAYVKCMEPYLDMNIKILREKIARRCAENQVFDLKQMLQYYVIDTLGELAFSQTFGVQLADDESLVPPVKEHSLLAAATGAWLPMIPLKSLQDLFAGRRACANLASRCVQKRLGDLNVLKDRDPEKVAEQRKDILTSLILAKHPDTGEHLTQADLETEAFGFM
jgi:cytochrome P450